MKNEVYSVWYGTVRASHYRLSGGYAIFFSWDKAQEYCDEMNKSSNTDSFMVVKEKIEPIKEKKK